jgi:hypothetical protein
MKIVIAFFFCMFLILATSIAYSQSANNTKVLVKTQTGSNKKVTSVIAVSQANNNINKQTKTLSAPGDNKTNKKFIRKNSKKTVLKDITKQ